MMFEFTNFNNGKKVSGSYKQRLEMKLIFRNVNKKAIKIILSQNSKRSSYSDKSSLLLQIWN